MKRSRREWVEYTTKIMIFAMSMYAIKTGRDLISVAAIASTMAGLSSMYIYKETQRGSNADKNNTGGN